MKALIVDDEFEYLGLLGMLLGQKGYEVEQYKDGSQAWAALQEASRTGKQVQLVITDWMIPGIEGPQLIRHIRQADFPTYTFIILMTARSSRPDMIEGYQAGADDYLIKPFEPDEVLARLSIAERILNLEKMLVDQREQLAIMASYDAVTGLLNRRKLFDSAVVEIARAQRQHEAVSIVMIDIDFFKSVNDRFGHASGDDALRMIANLIKLHLRPYDYAGRWGGEEFLLVLPGTSVEEALHIADRLRANLADSPLNLPDESTIKLTASFGVVSTSQFPDINFESLVDLADQALYQAKNHGRNRVEMATAPTNPARK